MRNNEGGNTPSAPKIEGLDEILGQLKGVRELLSAEKEKITGVADAPIENTKAQTYEDRKQAVFDALLDVERAAANTPEGFKKVVAETSEAIRVAVETKDAQGMVEGARKIWGAVRSMLPLGGISAGIIGPITQIIERMHKAVSGIKA